MRSWCTMAVSLRAIIIDLSPPMILLPTQSSLVLRAAAAQIGNYRLNGGALYVTIEPCVMCAGAILQSRVSRLVFGARDEKGGAVASLYCLLNDSRLNHQVEVTEGVLAEQCQAVIRAFFNERR